MTQILGTDIQIDEYGDIQLTTTGDIKKLSGLSNMYQAIRNRLSLERGELVYDKGYGLVLEEFIGSKGTIKNINQFKLELIKELKKDKRITGINNIQINNIEDNPKAYEVIISLRVAETQEEVLISFVFPFYSPETVSREISNERQNTIGKEKIITEYIIHQVKGIYLTTDTTQTGVNYFIGGYVLNDNKTIMLGKPVLSPNTPLLITYTTLETERIGTTTSLLSEIVTLVEDSSSGDNTTIDTIVVLKDIYDVIGVWDKDDTQKDRINYFYGGSYYNNTITLGTPLPYPRDVIVDYYTYIIR